MKSSVCGCPRCVSVWAGTGKVLYLAWDLNFPSYITWHFCAKAVEKKKIIKSKIKKLIITVFTRV